MQVSDLIVCAGARNLPILAALEETDFNINSYFEERSAGFYALGKSKFSNRAVAVVTTSGTAVAELLPAVIEAYYQNLPLILISADRPKSYRGSGSPQAIEHVGIFSSYVESTFDWDVSTSDFAVHYSAKKPIHINICFNEPLLDGMDGKLTAEKMATAQVIRKQKPETPHQETEIRNPIAIISEIKISDREYVKNYLLKNKIVHYAEFLSGLRNEPELAHLQIGSSEYFVKRLFTEKTAESVLRIGGIPTLRFWRDLEFDFKFTDVFSFSETEFSGLSRPSHSYNLQQLTNTKIKNTHHFDLVTDQIIRSEKIKLLSEFQNSEQNYTYRLSEFISSRPLYVGNSLPIRMWDAFTEKSQSHQQVCANRGANGIDGQISTYLGWAAEMNESWCVIGDLTALYDLGSLGLVAGSKNQYRIVIMNNSGGQIFSRLFGNKQYLNPQKVDFKSWASMWGWDHIQISESADFKKLESNLTDKVIIELLPANTQTELFWQKWDLICKI